WAGERGWRRAGVVASPLRGPAGNREFLCWLRAPEAAGATS
ncbi:MAG: 16S/23S rRNA (cytidine-2'-O)-methyltransferase, partial [Chloroflexota bacterium]|nr:16S/23S rRNA (cytidine-2'-O)-methyltransferase [Chloroflexota bacterium]